MYKYTDYVSHLQRIADVNCATALLHWDLEVYMPKGGAAFRSQQISTLAGMAHEMFTSEKTQKILHSLLDGNNLSGPERRNVELTLWDYQREVKLDKDFVERQATARSEAFNKWMEAREANDYAVFVPQLQTLIDLARQEADMRRYEAEPYDALLDLYERGLRAAFLDKLFGESRDKIIDLVSELNLTSLVETPNTLKQQYPKDAQWDFGIELLKALGYDFNTGRQDISPHPFTIAFSPQDVRVTTRVKEDDFLTMTWSCMHEAGHALYEQGLPSEQYGLPLGTSASLGIHESQSRLWENHVGRSRSFVKVWFPELQERFPENLGDVTPDAFYRDINRIQPNLIRTEADELHYHLHVIIRYEIERACINGNVSAGELKDLWNAKYKEYLGLDVPDDNRGILQDVHWAHGSFGYFPTYSLGSFYAAQFYHAASNRINGLEEDLEQGNYTRLLDWLRQNIHCHGRELLPGDLCRAVTGEILNIDYFIDYARDKYSTLYARD
jgi:carboxypeptidase Taq